MNNNTFKVHGICMIFQLLSMLAIIVIGAMLLFKVIFGLAISWNVFIIIIVGIMAAIFVISFIVAVVNMMKDC